MYKGFNKMSDRELKKTTAGWAMIAAFGALLPIILNSVVSTVASIKMMGSDKGSVKYKGLESHWDKAQSKKAAASKSVETFVYAY